MLFQNKLKKINHLCMNLEQLKFPIGRFKKPNIITKEILQDWIADIEVFPKRLSEEVANLSDLQLDTPYRSEGWTIRQVVHHCADSHMNSFIRLKLALTEESPIIKPYYEDRWAELDDSKNMYIIPSLKMLEGIHERWTKLLMNLSDEQLSRVFIHPEHGKSFRVDENIGIYAWHCNHHLAHIIQAKNNITFN